VDTVTHIDTYVLNTELVRCKTGASDNLGNELFVLMSYSVVPGTSWYLVSPPGLGMQG